MDRYTDIIEGLNAITDNASAWTPEQTAKHAQDLAVLVDRLRTTPNEQLYGKGPWLALIDGTPCKVLHDEGELEAFWEASERNDNLGSTRSLADFLERPTAPRAPRKVIQISTAMTDDHGLVQTLILLYNDGTIEEMVYGSEGWGQPERLLPR